jgi:hypothetical protein
MPHLKDRTRQVPNGYSFIQPQTGWQAPKWQSFDALVKLIINHRKGNMWAVHKYSLALDYDSIANEVDDYNTKICQNNGWNDFLIGEGGPPPKGRPLPGTPRPGLVAAGARMIAGIKTLKELFEGPPVASDLANTRAIQCSTCPNNQPGDLTSFFTIPAAKLIRDHLRERQNMGLSTPSDPLLGVCIGCSCPLKLKVHTPLSAINKHMNDEIRNALVPECWVLHEK